MHFTSLTKWKFVRSEIDIYICFHSLYGDVFEVLTSHITFPIEGVIVFVFRQCGNIKGSNTALIKIVLNSGNAPLTCWATCRYVYTHEESIVKGRGRGYIVFGMFNNTGEISVIRDHMRYI